VILPVGAEMCAGAWFLPENSDQEFPFAQCLTSFQCVPIVSAVGRLGVGINYILKNNGVGYGKGNDLFRSAQLFGD
jgi:hypothetical protein